MSIFDLEEKRPILPNQPDAENIQPYGLSDYFNQNLLAGQGLVNPNFSATRKIETYRQQARDYDKITGGSFEKDIVRYAEENNFDPREVVGQDMIIPFADNEALLKSRFEIYDSFFNEKKEEFPDLAGFVTSQDMIEELEVEQDAKDEAVDIVGASIPDGPLKTIVGGLGTMGAQFSDGENVWAMAIGGGARGVLKAGLEEAALSGLVELSQQNRIAEFQKSIGREYGLKEKAFGVATAGVLGGVTGGIRGLTRPSRAAVLEDFAVNARDRGAKNTASAFEIDADGARKADFNMERFGGEDASTALAKIDKAVQRGRSVISEDFRLKDGRVQRIDPSKVDEPGLRDEIIEMERIWGDRWADQATPKRLDGDTPPSARVEPETPPVKPPPSPVTGDAKLAADIMGENPSPRKLNTKADIDDADLNLRTGKDDLRRAQELESIGPIKDKQLQKSFKDAGVEVEPKKLRDKMTKMQKLQQIIRGCQVNP